MISIANNGRGVHLLKPGSKRRRTKDNMSEQIDEERASAFDRDAMNAQVQEQQEYIAKLQAELEETKEHAHKNQMSTDWLKDNISKKKIFLDENSIPVIAESLHQDDEENQTR